MFLKTIQSVADLPLDEYYDEVARQFKRIDLSDLLELYVRDHYSLDFVMEQIASLKLSAKQEAFDQLKKRITEETAKEPHEVYLGAS